MAEAGKYYAWDDEEMEQNEETKNAKRQAGSQPQATWRSYIRGKGIGRAPGNCFQSSLATPQG